MQKVGGRLAASDYAYSLYILSRVSRRRRVNQIMSSLLFSSQVNELVNLKFIMSLCKYELEILLYQHTHCIICCGSINWVPISVHDTIIQSNLIRTADFHSHCIISCGSVKSFNPQQMTNPLTRI